MASPQMFNKSITLQIRTQLSPCLICLMCAWCTTALTTLLVVFFKLLTEWLIFIIVPILCCSRQQQCLHGCHLAGREVIAGFKFLQDERICVLYVRPIQSASHVPQDLYILSAQAQAIYTLKTENRKMLYLKNCACMQPYQCQSVIHAFITFRHIHVKKTKKKPHHSPSTQWLHGTAASPYSRFWRPQRSLPHPVQKSMTCSCFC